MVTFERPGLGRLAGLLDYIYIGVTPNTRVRLLVRCAYVEHASFFLFFFFFFLSLPSFLLPAILSEIVCRVTKSIVMQKRPVCSHVDC